MGDRIQDFTKIGMFGDTPVYGYANTDVRYNEYAFSPVEVAKIDIALKEISETPLGADVAKGIKSARIKEIKLSVSPVSVFDTP